MVETAAANLTIREEFTVVSSLKRATYRILPLPRQQGSNFFSLE